MKTKQIADFVKKNKKSLLIALGVLIIALAVRLVWRKKRGLGGVRPKTVSEIESGTGYTVTPSTDFYRLAQRLWDATVAYHSLPWFVYWWPSGTNEEEVYAVLGVLNNQADYMMLEAAWVNYFKEQSFVVRNFSLQAEGSVPAVLKSELTKSELQKCREILLSKGITPDF